MTATRSLVSAPLLVACVLMLLAAALGGWQYQAADDSTLHLAGPVQGPETLDPAQVRDLAPVTILRQIFRGLVYYDAELNPVPELAESWEVTEDGRRYTFRLREGATFHDGTPIEASDVLFSLSRAVDPDVVEGDVTLLGGPAFLSDIVGFDDVLNGITDELAGVRVVSASVIEIELVAPRSTFLMKLASVPASIVDQAQVESDGTWWARPNGSGPFKVDRWEPGDSLDLDRYSDFVLGKPLIRSIEFRLGSRSLQSFNLYQSGDIDIDSITLADIDRVADPNGEFQDQLIETGQFGFGYLALNLHIEPMQDPKIREALQLAMPRDEIAEILFNGWVLRASGLVADGMLGRSWPDVLPAQDLDAARQAIADSTYGSSENVPTIRIYTSGALSALALQEIAREELGLKIEVFDLDWYDFLDRLALERMPAYELFWAADYPDPEAILLALFGTGQPDNSIGYSNPEFDQLLSDAANEPDPEIRAQLYERAERVLAADNVVVPIYWDVQYTVVKPWVHDLVVTPIGILRLETVRIES